MTKRYSLLITLALVGTHLLALASPLLPPPAATPVNTVAIAPTEKLLATLTLANQHTLLFFPTHNSPQVRVVALLPSGQTAWEAALVKNHIALNPKRTAVDLTDRTRTTIEPLLLTSAGNTTYAVEAIGEDAPKGSPPRHTLLVQELSPAGQVSRKTFAVPAPADKTQRVLLTAFAEEGVVYAVAKEENKREETGQFFLDRCDLRTGSFAHTALPLPQPPAVKNGDEFYRDWVFGGHRAGQVYFYRAVKGTDAKANARDAAIEYDVKVLGTDGSEKSSFTTALHKNLPAQTFVQGGTLFPHQGQAHAPLLGKAYDPIAQSITVTDLFDASTGGNGDFVLDPATGNCLFTGQYSNAVFDIHRFGIPSLGTFVQSYAPDGRLVAAATAPYAKLPGFSEKMLMAQPQGIITGLLLHDPQTQELTLQFRTKAAWLVSGYDAQLKPRPLQLVPQLQRKASYDWAGDIVSWSKPGYLRSPDEATSGEQGVLMLDGLLASPVALYQSIGQLINAQITETIARKSKAGHDYTVSATGPASVLVLQAPTEAGGQVKVFEVK